MQIFVHTCQIFVLLFDTKSQRRKRKETKQIKKINIVPTKKTLSGKRKKKEKKLMLFPFLEREDSSCEAIARQF